MILRISAASKIKVFAGLGYLKEKVLKEHGVIKLDNDQDYSGHLRAQFFEFTKSSGETNSHLRFFSTFY